jgi:2',3'-cyclic-nucleotide 2'-phosphodiesterase (5'-nucleotidase family)
VPVLKLDSGNFRDSATAAGDTRTDALLEAMQRLGYQAVNVAERDVRLGYAKFVERTAEVEIEFISANLIREDTKAPLFKPHLLLDVVSADGKTKRRVGVIGVVRGNPLFREPGPGDSVMVIDDPVTRVRAEVESLRSQGVDAIIVLAALHKFDARKILEQVEGIDFVLGSHGDTVTPRPERYGDGWVMYGGNHGSRIVEARMFLDGRAQDFARVHYLSNSYSFDPEMLDYVNSIYNDPEPGTAQENVICEPGAGS